MLPLLRMLPFGSLLLTALILALAATPPRKPVPSDALGPARGALIDAAEHPEWRQFYVQAAFRRADELEHLRDLPNTPTRMPVVAAPEAQKTAAEPAPDKEIVGAFAPALPAPVQRNEAPSAPERKDIAPAPPALATPDVTAPAAGTEQSPLAGPPAGQIAGLPTGRDNTDSDGITGALDSPAIAATMPIEIGETSSTELPVVLPPERPSRLPVPRPRASSRAKAQHAPARPNKTKRPVRAAKRPAGPAAKKTAQPASAQASPFQSLFGEH